MNIRNVDLNLLVYLNVLLEERSVSKAANKLALTQPAMSNALNRLRELFNDPLLVRTANGMVPTQKASGLKADITALLALAEQITQKDEEFDPSHHQQTFRIVTNDYIEACLLTPFLLSIIAQCPGINFDILTPGDINLADMEQGNIDLAINRFSVLPKSFHQASVWRDNFCCVSHIEHPYAHQPDLANYLAAEHIWVNRPGWQTENTATNKSGNQHLGWVDEALWQLEQTRKIRVYSRHYAVVDYLLRDAQLLATLPRRQAMLLKHHPSLCITSVPFQIVPIEIKMIWSPLLQHNQAHQWLRRQLLEFAKTIVDR
ncbi:LysR family transcriptional regulator [Pseudoalteromonas tunicata]|uniref:Putative transcriptional regulator of the LysR family protein n=1 Tax=Pseudoalteromonas tunicata D2 TaxID=87626 RepID=A4CAQ3_9GAMM|nr:LysR family transcriptional regulator [Pseudoalteromonas tunicata]ATC95006.1 hypothetical protein PTUN_a2545 [Pseudoalteromonas tunicata]AXT30662.1 LysR family transcriptional regulator [Pseudoalteromonas tunicata]EAR28461.1 putative transcriptional regulator of the LysR family protein [Pseudoalteromonas tunicata D2]MDP4984714.1 LysR family transcriptional regulator [Pseudoalteromonas tunicata]MDP5214078.1 LysR family transcriptional regulator [Pseudoalteromonas tunicata]